MKIKVDKDEYELLLERVVKLEKEIESLVKEIDDGHLDLFENWRWTRENLYNMMEHYFDDRTRVTLIKRDKDEIIGELKALTLDNLFKEEK